MFLSEVNFYTTNTFFPGCHRQSGKEIWFYTNGFLQISFWNSHRPSVSSREVMTALSSTIIITEILLTSQILFLALEM